MSAEEPKVERADKGGKNKELRESTGQIIEEYNKENINHNQVIIQDFNSSDITLDIFADFSNFV